MSASSVKPNIVLIISDDHGSWALGSAGNRELITPNLDSLASEGIRFENFFCASPVCSPARVSIFTGKMPSQHGVHDWLAAGYIDSDRELDPELKKIYASDNVPWEYQWGKSQLKDDRAIRYLDGQTTFSELLAKNGYTCGLSGKWHMGGSNTPQAGFSYWQSIAMGGDNYMYPTVRKNGMMKMLRGKYITDYITENALAFLDENAGKESPFYLSVHYTAPHSPWTKEHHPSDVYSLYDNCEFNSVPDDKPHKWDKNVYSDNGKVFSADKFMKCRRENLQGYYTAITAMDRGIGDILAKLDSMGVRENTVIIFTGDNGMCMGHHGLFGKGNATWPMNMFEESVKVPFIISCPKLMPSGKVAEGMFSHYDIIHTINDYFSLGEKLPESLPGKSFAPLLRGEECEGNGAVVICDEYGPVRMYRTRQYKYVERYGELKGLDEFYDLISDPGEKTNLIDFPEYMQLIEEYAERLNNWFEKHCDERFDGRLTNDKGVGQLSPVYPSYGKEHFVQPKTVYKDPSVL